MILATLGEEPEQLLSGSDGLCHEDPWRSAPVRETPPLSIMLVMPGAWVGRSVTPGSHNDLLTRGPITPPDWMSHALCAELPEGVADKYFFSDIEKGRKICRECPVRRECLGFALAMDADFGIWGGTSGRQRRSIKKRIADGVSTLDDELERWTGGQEEDGSHAD